MCFPPQAPLRIWTPTQVSATRHFSQSVQRIAPNVDPLVSASPPFSNHLQHKPARLCLLPLHLAEFHHRLDYSSFLTCAYIYTDLYQNTDDCLHFTCSLQRSRNHRRCNRWVIHCNCVMKYSIKQTSKQTLVCINWSQSVSTFLMFSVCFFSLASE